MGRIGIILLRIFIHGNTGMFHKLDVFLEVSEVQQKGEKNREVGAQKF